MLRKTMIALCAMASIGMLAPDMALARGGGGGSGGHGGGMGGGGRGMGGGSFGGHANFSGGNFAARGMNGGNFNSFARATPNVAQSNVAVQGNRFAAGNFAGNRFAHANFNRPGFHHGFRHRHVFFAGGFIGPYDYWDYPDYAYNDDYDDSGCYVVQRRVHTSYGWRIRPVQVCG